MKCARGLTILCCILLSLFSEVEGDVAKQYTPLQKHPQLFDDRQGWLEGWFDPAFNSMMRSLREGNESALWELLHEETPGVYSFPMWTPKFCRFLMEEIDNYKQTGLPIRRPNSMNNYGLVVNEIGMLPMLTKLQQIYLQPIAKLLFPEEGAVFHGHHSFMVQYKQGEDLGLDMHTDDSDVTFNICLGKEFVAAGLTLCGTVGTPDHRQLAHKYDHIPGRCIVHLGSKRHGADDIITGERNNLIVWNHNEDFRARGGTKARGFAKESDIPHQDCLSYTHDRDYSLLKEFPQGERGRVAKATNKRQAWCPPNHACYDSMAPVLKRGSSYEFRHL
ncbi:hypothetical protein CYMTET_24604 [Cymbomonas tetramitiformis]|uniref:Fe2OG dioxygenase domain-containing protein n=1 Tax=Cymbomonas tetramitiformis TaxID=36881 RepID=A0AAE0FW93_9CHLO|nr:hypothetical protein CYMTET_24604 [Cymbomonas tetramitiformis]